VGQTQRALGVVTLDARWVIGSLVDVGGGTLLG
jgi:hypothetical protein